jgi:hypothetical protein
MNTGIQDAANLAWKLAHTLHGMTPSSIVDTYGVEREPIGRKVLRTSDRAFTIATSTNPLVRFARTRLAPAVLPLALRAGNGRGLVFRTVAQLRIGYRDSPLSANGPGVPRREIRAGDRLPDAPITIDGHTSSLHALIATPTWSLLLCGPGWPASAPDAVADRAAVVAMHHLDGAGCAQALRRLGVRPRRRALLLVRPDGHVGLHVTDSSTAITALKSYMDRWLPRQLT